MAERPENRDAAPGRENRPAGFTDASYIPRDEAPNLPRVYTFPEPKEERERAPVRLSAGTIAALCVLCLCLGFAVQYRLSRSGAEEAAPEPSPPEEELLRLSPETADAPDGETPCLGVTVQTVTSAVADYYNQFEDERMVVGVHIYAMDDDGAAARAGLRRGDILTAVDGRAVLTAGELTAAEEGYRPGERAVLTVYREREYLEIPVEFAPRSPETDNRPEW